MIRFEQVTKRFGRKTVLDDVSFEIDRGETFVIVGLSGAGKSVSLRHMVRLLTPESGRMADSAARRKRRATPGIEHDRGSGPQPLFAPATGVAAVRLIGCA